MELVTGGELFHKIASRGRLKEDDARKYFQQLINAVNYCHSRGVYHCDLKENGLLHTTCGTPNYVAPEVINNKGYDGAKADLWSCGVILFVLMVGYLPFEDSNLMSLYKKIFKSDFSCPSWFSTSAKQLIKKIPDPNPSIEVLVIVSSFSFHLWTFNCALDFKTFVVVNTACVMGISICSRLLAILLGLAPCPGSHKILAPPLWRARFSCLVQSGQELNQDELGGQAKERSQEGKPSHMQERTDLGTGSQQGFHVGAIWIGFGLPNGIQSELPN